MTLSPQDLTQRWTQLLSHQRLHAKPTAAPFADPLTGRTPFDADYGRLVFSSSFRRLQDKTQVFPLAKSDYTRTRLTHTLGGQRGARAG